MAKFVADTPDVISQILCERLELHHQSILHAVLRAAVFIARERHGLDKTQAQQSE
jgi:hypothetical protein